MTTPQNFAPAKIFHCAVLFSFAYQALPVFNVQHTEKAKNKTMCLGMRVIANIQWLPARASLATI